MKQRFFEVKNALTLSEYVKLVEHTLIAQWSGLSLRIQNTRLYEAASFQIWKLIALTASVQNAARSRCEWTWKVHTQKRRTDLTSNTIEESTCWNENDSNVIHYPQYTCTMYCVHMQAIYFCCLSEKAI